MESLLHAPPEAPKVWNQSHVKLGSCAEMLGILHTSEPKWAGGLLLSDWVKALIVWQAKTFWETFCKELPVLLAPTTGKTSWS